MYSNEGVLKELISSLSYDRKEIYLRISLIESKKKLSKKDNEALKFLYEELEDVKGRLRRFENAILNRLEE